MVLDTLGQTDHLPVLSALTIEERELALGYPYGCTDAPFLAATPEDTYAVRHRAHHRMCFRCKCRSHYPGCCHGHTFV